MSDQSLPDDAAGDGAVATAPSKAELVCKLLSRSRGATVQDLVEATGWQAHSVRAQLTRLRHAGHVLERLERKSGSAAYHIVKPATAAEER